MSNRLKILLIIFAVFFVVFGVFYYVIIPYKAGRLQPHYLSSQWLVMPSNKIINLEIADTEAERAQGLSGRDRIADNEGMWFVFDQEGIHPFWMKDMKFNIDIIWLDEDHSITDIIRNAPVPEIPDDLSTYSNTKPAKYVLEVNSGVSEELSVGDILRIKYQTF